MRLRPPQKFAKLRSLWLAGYDALSRFFDGHAHRRSHVANQNPSASRELPLFLLSLGVACATAWLLVSPSPRTRPLPAVTVGDIAESTLVSPLTIEIEPRETQRRNREQLYKKTAPVFDYDETALAIWLQNWSQTFSTVRQQFFSSTAKTRLAPVGQSTERIREIIRKETGQSLSLPDTLFLIKNRFSKELEQVFHETAKPLLGHLIAETDLFASHYSTGIIVRQINLGLQETLINDVSRIWSAEQARQLISQAAGRKAKHKSPYTKQVAEIIQSIVPANLKINTELTEKRLKLAIGRKDSLLVSLKKGQILVRMGERVTEGQADIIESLRSLTSTAALVKRFLILGSILCLFFLLLFHLDLSRRSFLRLNLKNALVFSAIGLMTLACMKWTLPFLQPALNGLGLNIGAEYLLPVTTGAVLIQLLMGRELAITFALQVAVCGGILVEGNLFYGIWVFAVSIVGIQSLGQCKTRGDLYRCGTWSGLAGAFLILGFDLYQSLGLVSIDWKATIVHFSGGFLSGLFTSIFSSTLIPVLESVFGYTTNLKLLELSNFNHPLLHNLMMKAPGTYHHSIMVGSLAEIAADRIKANSLLARVSAYYHDIGKMANPLYFIENQSPQYNPHDHLSPSISARILFSHVKNGTRMGKEHGLGEPINDIIQQHHGTTMATFFYNKAKEEKGGNESEVNESDYRYPGPRPQSREAAIVMIADACEAATRSIPGPTAVKIQAMVHNIINRRFLDLQFHDCDLTLKDLQTIEECISRTLLSLYHHRIEYPGQTQALGEATVEIQRKTL